MGSSRCPEAQEQCTKNTWVWVSICVAIGTISFMSYMTIHSVKRITEYFVCSRNYFVKLPEYKYGEVWNLDKLERNKKALLLDHPNVMISELIDISSVYREGDTIEETDEFVITADGKPAMIWDSDKFRKNMTILCLTYPDAKVYRIRDVNNYVSILSQVKMFLILNLLVSMAIIVGLGVFVLRHYVVSSCNSLSIEEDL